MPTTTLPNGAIRLPDTPTHRNRIQIVSETTPGKFYVIAIDSKTGTPTCACPGFIYRRTCKHLNKYADLLRRSSAPQPRKPRRSKKPQRETVPVPWGDIELPELTPEQLEVAAAGFDD